MQEKLESETLMKCERMVGEARPGHMSPSRSKPQAQPKDTEATKGEGAAKEVQA
jgi:hypothetical protein